MMPSPAAYARRLNLLRQAIASNASLDEIARQAALLCRDADHTDVVVDPAEIAAIVDSLRPRFAVFNGPGPSAGDGTPPLEAVLWNSLRINRLNLGSRTFIAVGHPVAPSMWERVTGRPIGD
jgi:hypothetical protein